MMMMMMMMNNPNSPENVSTVTTKPTTKSVCVILTEVLAHKQVTSARYIESAEPI